MTCIVGIIEKGKIYLAGDSAGVAGLDVIIRKDPKVFKIGNFVMGFTSSFRMGQILMKSFIPPKITKTDEKDIYKYMTTKFIDKVRKTFKSGGYLETKQGTESGGVFLVGVKGRLFRIGSDFQVGESYDRYAAVGCGESYALAAMHTLLQFPVVDLEQTPQRKLQIALETAAKFSGGVRGPFNHVNT